MTESDEAMTVEKRIENQGKVLEEHGKALGEHGRLLRSLRVLYDHHDEQIQRIAEVQTAHGVKLDQHGSLLEEHGQLLREIKGELAGVKGALGEVKGALKPLPEIHDFVKRIANEHEARIAALEKPATAQ